jgi:hypothetical protein
MPFSIHPCRRFVLKIDLRRIVLACGLTMASVAATLVVTPSVAQAWLDWREVCCGSTPSAPGGAANSAHQFLFVRGTNNGIYLNQWSGPGWSGWGELPGGGRTVDAPAAVALETGLVMVFVRGTDDRIYHNTLNNGSWGGWQVMANAPMTNAAPAVTYKAGFVYIALRGYNGRIYWSRYNFVQWAPFAEVFGNGLTPSSPAIAPVSNGVAVIVRGIDDAVYMNKFDGVTWTGWGEIPGAGRTLSGPGAATPEIGGVPHSLNIAVRGTDNQIYVNRRLELTGEWSGWRVIPGGRTTSSPALIFAPQLVNAYVRGTDDKIYRNVDGSPLPR